jgi:hypothetical protein
MSQPPDRSDNYVIIGLAEAEPHPQQSNAPHFGIQMTLQPTESA